MIPLGLSEVALLVGARSRLEGTVTGEVRVDSRLVQPGDLFVALPGERVDGHDHVQAAAAAGAVAALVTREVPSDVPLLVVPDALSALQDLAAAVFGRDQPLTVGVTGSSGKTSTKDLLGQVLGAFGDTLFPEGSFNNELGLPLTALRRTAATRYAALEYSARGVGHIAFLCGIVQPDVAVVLNVGSAHLGEFGSKAAIAQAKGELVEAARQLAVLNADDPLVLGMASRTEQPVITFGSGADADVRGEGLEIDADGRARFSLVAPQGSADVALTVVGEHQASNALAVATALLGTVTDDVERVAALLSAATPLSRWRMEVAERSDGVTVVNDAYNANPDSMRAALKTLAVMSRAKTRRTWAVLGPMAELGEDSRQAHMDLGRFLVRLDPTALVVVGKEAGGIYAGAVLEGSWGGESVHVDDADEALALLRAGVRPGDVVLVKASRSAGLEKVAAALLEEDTP
ncbi:MAG: UDP-N-acetylmuramoylalanyl-D-glutamyl-2,6-diaminopimelate/D-alanyl-D-alanyl ligase [Frankiales bacterium]|nr:UDP-N-acetylmuramoylalanyl-D-glutamyl-2,6-diaminopimelate/D-alanyl-D-alanyl ligase [Frankiales bacterium]